MTSAADHVIGRFHDVLGDVMAHAHTHYWLHGGRGSTKSSFISLCIVLLVMAKPKANAVVVRRFGNTLRDSVYQQVLWAISVLGVEAWFRAKVSPMEIVYLPTGQRIVFRGADDPLKLKGVKFTHGYCAVTWFEELDQFEGIEAIRSILNSLRRGGDDFWIFYSYNPPGVGRHGLVGGVLLEDDQAALLRLPPAAHEPPRVGEPSPVHAVPRPGQPQDALVAQGHVAHVAKDGPARARDLAQVLPPPGHLVGVP